MIFSILLFVIGAVQILSFHQTDYRVVHERIAVDFYNKSWLKDVTFILFHYTRTEKRMNASGYLLHDLTGRDIINTIQGYKFQSNEYRLFPLNYSGNACDIKESNTFGTDIANFDTNATICPSKQGFSYIANVHVDETQFPPYAPRGRYMLDMKIIYNKTILLVSGKWYGAIEATDPLEKVILG